VECHFQNNFPREKFVNFGVAGMYGCNEHKGVTKKIFDSKSESEIKLGRSGLEWLEVVQNDLREMEAIGNNIEERASIVEEDRFPRGSPN
jgi:hypothetical protein